MPVVAGVELSDEKSEDHLRKGTPKFSQLSTPLLDSLILDDLRDVTELLAHSMDSGVVGRGDFLDERRRPVCEDGEEWRGLEDD
jgi:hypothetical protein